MEFITRGSIVLSATASDFQEAVNQRPAVLTAGRCMALIAKKRPRGRYREAFYLVVPRDRIELPTRGFSVLCSTD
jgi:hypothetical protein